MPKKNDITEKAQKLVEKFKEECKKEGISILPDIIFKKGIEESVNQREISLVKYIIGTYLTPTFSHKELPNPPKNEAK